MKRLSMVFACFLIIGCTTTNVKGPEQPDRGTIPNVEPIKPPSMTNEFRHVEGQVDVLYKGAWIGEQKLIIEVNGQIKEEVLENQFGHFSSAFLTD